MNFESVLLLYLFHTAKASFVAWGSWVLQHELRRCICLHWLPKHVKAFISVFSQLCPLSLSLYNDFLLPKEGFSAELLTNCQHG